LDPWGHLAETLASAGAEELRVATLGPEGTSSELAARNLLELFGREAGSGDAVRLYPSYEEAAEAVLAGKETAVVVANAYAKINALYMNPALALAGAFIMDTPGYGVAACTRSPLPLKTRVATHPAPASLIAELLPPSFLLGDTVGVSSTSEAARMVARGEIDLALTNESSARRHNLRFVSQTRPIRMLWSVFVARSGLGRED
jgi:ABC-type amino acid transport substrate-binding protein